MEKKHDDIYAELILRKGINLQKGQCVKITSTVETYPFALNILEKAYKLGAGYVVIDVISDYTTLYRAEFSNNEFITYSPDYAYAVNNTIIAEKWASISITNTSEFDVLKDANMENVQTIMKYGQIARKKLRNSLMSDKQPWCVVAYPQKSWAKRIFDNENSLDLLEKVFIKIMRLDEEDVLGYWDLHSKILKKRCALLNDFKLDRVVFKNQSGELSVGLNETSLWHGGPAHLPDTRLFMPNLPTEEVFTTPDYRRTNGVISVVKPVEVFGTTVKDLVFHFKDGQVTHFEASQGYDTIAKYLTIDSQAKFLGEVALVDKNSPINTSGLFFNSILFDENASSHIALGGGYPSCIKDSDSLITDNDKLQAGCNVSSVHTDFMIGDQNTQVIGYTKDNNAIEIMIDGTFCISD